MELTVDGRYCPFKKGDSGGRIGLCSLTCKTCRDYIGKDGDPYGVFCKKDLEEKCKKHNLNMSYISDGVKCSESNKEINKWNCSSCDSYEYGIADKYILCKKQDMEKNCSNCGFQGDNDPKNRGCNRYRKEVSEYIRCINQSEWKSIKEVKELDRLSKEKVGDCKFCGFGINADKEDLDCQSYRDTLDQKETCPYGEQWKSINDVEMLIKLQPKKECSTCGFRSSNNPKNTACNDYRKELSQYHGRCSSDGNNYWKSIDDVERLVEEFKNCETCGFSSQNNSTGDGCFTYRKEISQYWGECKSDEHDQWKSIDDVQNIVELQTKEANRAKICKTCGFSSDNNSTGDVCNAYRKKLGLPTVGLCSDDDWKSIDDVEKMAGKEVEKTCDNCGYSKPNNGENLDCITYRTNFVHALGDPPQVCWGLDEWISIDDLDISKRAVISCDNCGFAPNNSNKLLDCGACRRELNLPYWPCSKHDSWRSIDAVKALNGSLNAKDCNNCGFSYFNDPERRGCEDYRREVSGYIYCENNTQWKSIKEVEKLKKDKIKLDKIPNIEYCSSTESIFPIRKMSGTLGVPSVSISASEAGKNLRNQLLKKENTMTNQNETTKEMQIRKMSDAAKTAARIKVGEAALKAAKEALKKALPNIPLDNPIASGFIALLASFAIDNTRFVDNEKAQFVTQGMLERAAVDGIEATGIIEMIEGVIESTLAKIDFKETVVEK